MKRARLAALVALLLVTAACSRGLTPSETEAAHALFGDTLDTRPVRVMAGLGITPLPRPPKPDAAVAASGGAPGPAARKPPKGLCVRHQSTHHTWTWPAAFTLYDKIYFSYRFYEPDALGGFPRSVPFPGSLLMLHELTHVWQWQNRARTDYTIEASAGETIQHTDPYWWVPEAGRTFLSYGYEQQAAMVQDFVCYALFAPDDPKLAELEKILRPVIPVDGFLKAIGR